MPLADTGRDRIIVPADDSKAMVTKYRDQIVSALDYLFLGV